MSNYDNLNMSDNNSDLEDTVHKVKNDDNIAASGSGMTYIIVLILLLALVAIIIAIVALFFPKAAPAGTYSRVLNVAVNSYNGKANATSYSSASLNLDTSKAAGTLYLLNSAPPTTAGSVLVPIIINGSSMTGNSTFTLFNTTSSNTMYLVFNNFNNISTNDIIILNEKSDSITCYLDNNKNLYYSFSIMYPYTNGYNTVYNKTNGVSVTTVNVSTTDTAPSLISLGTTTLANVTSLPEGNALSLQNNSSANPGYVYIITDNLLPTSSGMNYLLNNTPNTIYYTYGPYASYTALSSTVSTASSATINAYYVFSLKGGQNAVLLYHNGTIIYPVIKTA